MSDFIDEMQEDLKREKLFLAVRRSLKYVAALVLAVLMAVGVYYWRQEKESEALYTRFKQYESFVTALHQRGDPKEIEALYSSLQKRKDGFCFLALLQGNTYLERRYFGEELKAKIQKNRQEILSWEDRRNLPLSIFLESTQWLRDLVRDPQSPRPQALSMGLGSDFVWSDVACFGELVKFLSKDQPGEASQYLKALSLDFALEKQGGFNEGSPYEEGVLFHLMASGLELESQQKAEFSDHG